MDYQIRGLPSKALGWTRVNIGSFPSKAVKTIQEFLETGWLKVS